MRSKTRSVALGTCTFLASVLISVLTGVLLSSSLAHATEPPPTQLVPIAQATTPTAPASPTTSASPYGMVDPIDPRFNVAYSLYLDSCATCHVALPPAVLPVATWQVLITDTAHYGLVLPDPLPFNQQLMLSYLQTYSRQHQGRGPLPYRLKDSAYFQALHPNVAFSQPVGVNSCTSCHSGAAQQDYTQLVTVPQ